MDGTLLAGGSTNGTGKATRKATVPDIKKKRGSQASESESESDLPKRKRKRTKPPNHRKNIKKIMDTNQMNEETQVSTTERNTIGGGDAQPESGTALCRLSRRC